MTEEWAAIAVSVGIIYGIAIADLLLTLLAIIAGIYVAEAFERRT